MNIKKPSEIEFSITPEVFAALPPDMKFKLLALGALLLSGAVSIGATVAKNIQEGDGIPSLNESTRVEAKFEHLDTPLGTTPDIFPAVVLSSHKKGSSQQGGATVVDGGSVQVPIARQSRFESGTQETEVSIRNIRTEEHKLFMKWAELFSADPEAKKFKTPAEAQAVIDSLNQIVTDGYTIDLVELQGFASDEDDTSDGKPKSRNPGFGVRSIKNEQLADRRAEAAQEVLRAVIADQGIHIATLPGREIQDPEQAEDIFKVAKKYKINPVRMVKLFNRNPRALPQEVQDVLASLKDDRFVRVTVRAHRDDQISTSSSAQRESLDESGRGSIDGAPSLNVSSEEQQEGDDKKLFILLIPVVLLPLIKAKVSFEDVDIRFRSGSRDRSPILPVAPVPIAAGAEGSKISLRDLVGDALLKKATNNEEESTQENRDGALGFQLVNSGASRQSRKEARLGRRPKDQRIKQPRPHNVHGSRTPGREGPQPLTRKGRGYPR